MGRLNSAVLERAEGVADRVLVLAKELDRRRVYLRVVDQLVGCGTSVGANIFEANEAMSTKDWLKCMGIAAKELAETRFWLKRIEKQAWITPTRLKPLQTECDSLQKVIGAMVVATKRKSKTKNRSA